MPEDLNKEYDVPFKGVTWWYVKGLLEDTLADLYDKAELTNGELTKGGKRGGRVNS